MGLLGYSNEQWSNEERALARMSVRKARQDFERANKNAREELNDFARDPDSDLALAGRLTQLGPARAWYNFWERSRGIPRELQLCNGDRGAWDRLAADAIDAVLAAAADADETTWSAPRKVFWTGADITCQQSRDRSERGAPFLRLHAPWIEAPPRVLLLLQLQQELRGRADKSLLYAREHFRFRGERAIVLHSIREAGFAFGAPREFVELVVWDELPDGSVVLARRSLTNCAPKIAVPGTVRGQTRLCGCVWRPQTQSASWSLLGGGGSVRRGCEVTVIHHASPQGWAWGAIANSGLRKRVAQELLDAEKVAQTLRTEHKADGLVRRHVLRQLHTPEV